jgi:hypothetical protein
VIRGRPPGHSLDRTLESTAPWSQGKRLCRPACPRLASSIRTSPPGVLARTRPVVHAPIGEVPTSGPGHVVIKELVGAGSDGKPARDLPLASVTSATRPFLRGGGWRSSTCGARPQGERVASSCPPCGMTRRARAPSTRHVRTYAGKREARDGPVPSPNPTGASLTELRGVGQRYAGQARVRAGWSGSRLRARPRSGRRRHDRSGACPAAPRTRGAAHTSLGSKDPDRLR